MVNRFSRLRSKFLGAVVVALGALACGDGPDDGSGDVMFVTDSADPATAGDDGDATATPGSTGGGDEGTTGASSGASDPTTAASANDSTGGTTTADGTADATDVSTDGGPGLDPPAGGSSGGSGGGAAAGDTRTTSDGVAYRMIAPGGAGPLPLMIVYSGTEGGAAMTANLQMVADFTGTAGFLFAVLDGVQYNGDGDAGASVLDDVRDLYDVDNDRTYLLSESAGTTAGLELGLELRQPYFAAYWANDVNASGTPLVDAAALGFAPWGNAGPGGAFAQADAIVAGMIAAGYRTSDPAPYDGPGAGTHGAPEQFLAAVQWFPGKSRQ